MQIIYRSAFAGLLLTLVGCTSAPVQESSKQSAQAIEPAPTAVPTPDLMSVPAIEPSAGVPTAEEPAQVEVAAPVAVVKPVPKPAPAARPAPIAKPVVEEAAPQPEVAAVGSISGSLKLVAGQGQSVSAGEVSEGLVYFLPKAGSPKPKPGRFVINTRSKGFIPETLVVPQGSTVRFPNVDTIIHNVYSRSPGNSFDLGYYAPGKSPEYTFNTAGLAIVNCTVHHTMRANVVVLATPYYTRPGKDGRYQIKDVPPGPGTLVFWHPRANAKSIQANAPLTGSAAQTLVASKSPQVH